MSQWLDEYQGTNVPGQPWVCYRSKEFDEKPSDKNLRQILKDLLALSTTREELNALGVRRTKEGRYYKQYLRIGQKHMDKDEWLVDGQMYNGAHYPTCAFTGNEGSRSEMGQQKRDIKRN